MRTIPATTLNVILALFALPSFAQTPGHLWSQRFGTGSDAGNAVVVDGSGNVVVTGRFSGTMNFGGSDLVSAGIYDIFVAKFNVNGVHQWSKRFGSTGVDFGNGVAVDGSGNVVVTGYFNGTVNFGGGDFTSAGGNDIFLAKYNASGAHQWSDSFGGTSIDLGDGVALDGAGNVVVTGRFNGTVDLGGGPLMSAGSNEIFVAKYDASGVHQWSQRRGSVGSDVASAVAVDGSGNALVTGHFNGTVDFGGGPRVSAGGNDIFVAKYDASGAHQWSQRFGSTNPDYGYDVAVDGSGNVMVTGGFSGAVDFGGGNLANAGNTDVFLARYDASGAHQWSQSFGSAGTDDGLAVAADGLGNTAITGQFQNTVSFGGGNLVSAGVYDLFIARFDATGAHQWSQSFGSTTNDYGQGIAVGDHVLVTGLFNGTVDFGGGDLVSPAAAPDDVFVAKYGALAAEPVITSIADIRNDQGRQVRVSFTRSGRDDPSASIGILEYIAYRRIDSLPAVAAGVSDAIGARAPDPRMLSDYESVGSAPAFGEGEYNMVVPTLADSTVALGMYRSAFFIRASTGDVHYFHDSPVDSGYSIDNLAPGVPASFAYNAGLLSWDESSATDFDYFSVYGSATSSFGSATLVDYTTATELDVNASPYVFYFVTATDFSGNEGNPAVINTLSGTGETPTQYVFSISSYPNPFNPETTVRYTVPAKGRVTIEVFDARGGHVATLVNQEMEAGAFTVTWNGQDDSGARAGSGVYFARLTSPAGHRSYKMTLLK